MQKRWAREGSQFSTARVTLMNLITNIFEYLLCDLYTALGKVVGKSLSSVKSVMSLPFLTMNGQKSLQVYCF